MTLDKHLTLQLTGFVDSYKKYLVKTFGVALSFTILLLLIEAILYRYSTVGKVGTGIHISLLSDFFYRYSHAETYLLIDMIKNVFIFFVALYSIGLLRAAQGPGTTTELSFKALFRHIESKDFLVLLLALLGTVIIDYFISKFDYYDLSDAATGRSGYRLHEWIYQLRTFVPLLLFSLTIRYLVTNGSIRISIKEFLLLYISLWLFNAFSIELFYWVRTYVFNIILFPFTESESYFLVESFAGIPLIAFYFPGLFWAMTGTLPFSMEQTLKNEDLAAGEAVSTAIDVQPYPESQL